LRGVALFGGLEKFLGGDGEEKGQALKRGKPAKKGIRRTKPLGKG